MEQSKQKRRRAIFGCSAESGAFRLVLYFFLMFHLPPRWHSSYRSWGQGLGKCQSMEAEALEGSMNNQPLRFLATLKCDKAIELRVHILLSPSQAPPHSQAPDHGSCTRVFRTGADLGVYISNASPICWGWFCIHGQICHQKRRIWKHYPVGGTSSGLLVAFRYSASGCRPDLLPSAKQDDQGSCNFQFLSTTKMFAALLQRGLCTAVINSNNLHLREGQLQMLYWINTDIFREWFLGDHFDLQCSHFILMPTQIVTEQSFKEWNKYKKLTSVALTAVLTMCFYSANFASMNSTVWIKKKKKDGTISQEHPVEVIRGTIGWTRGGVSTSCLMSCWVT